MGTITSSVGLISGINTGQIIDELMSIESQPVQLIQTRISSVNAQMQAYNDMETQLTSLQQIGMSLELPSTFGASTATSSDPNVLTATTTNGATQGSYQFQVAQLVSSQQSVSGGYTSQNAPLQAGTMTFELGGGNLGTQTSLSDLNGGGGVSRGLLRITDRSGKTDVINTTSDVTLDDVVNQINTSLNVSVKASIQNNKLVLTDTSGGSGTLSVQDLNGGSSAQDLGIAGSGSGNTLIGSTINYLSTTTALSSLNDGNGIRTRTSGSADLNISLADGTTVGIDLSGAQTVGDVINDINKVSPSKVKAGIAPGASGITLTDLTTGSNAFAATNVNGSHAAQDLGIAQTGSGGTINGRTVVGGIDSVLVSSLKGGAGLPLGAISITNRNGQTANVNFAGATSFQDILNAINSAGISVNASINSAGNGIQIQDTTGGSGNLIISDTGGGTTAASLGIAGTFNSTQSTVDGGDLHLQYVSQNTLLSNYNGGKGVAQGTFTITSAKGSSATIDLSQGTFNTIGDVLSAINKSGIGVTASIDANGNGILLTDTSGGAGKLTVKEGNSTTAADLHLVGTATGTTLDGSLEQTLTVNAGDTLSTLVTKINSANFGVAASIINDGSAGAPYRLSLTATNSGEAGRVLIGGGTTGLRMRNLVNAQDAAVFVGGAGTSQPLLVTSHTNQLTGVIPGVTVSLLAASANPVTLSITRDPSNVSKQLQNFTDAFNTLVGKLATYTHYDTTTNQGGVLLGDATAQEIQTQMYSIFGAAVKDAGNLHTVGDIGITMNQDGTISYNSTTFQNAYAQNPTNVMKLFTNSTAGLGKVLDHSMTNLVDPVTGMITQENTTLQNQTQQFQDQIKHLDSLLADKRNRLEEQFANMETVLAGLQSQQSALGSITTITAPKSTSSSSSSTSH
jgi:flagellar hook-associated protein 2